MEIEQITDLVMRVNSLEDQQSDTLNRLDKIETGLDKICDELNRKQYVPEVFGAGETAVAPHQGFRLEPEHVGDFVGDLNDE